VLGQETIDCRLGLIRNLDVKSGFFKFSIFQNYDIRHFLIFVHFLGEGMRSSECLLRQNEQS